MTNPAPKTGLTPHLTIRDDRAVEAIDFYVNAFDATELQRVPADDGKRLMHAHLGVNGASLMLHDDFPEYRGGGASPPRPRRAGCCPSRSTMPTNGSSARPEPAPRW